MSLLSAQNLRKQFRSRTVVHDVSLDINSGEIVGLLGPNGAGKTTSFNMIIGIIPADRGQVRIDDSDINHLPIDKRARLGLGYLPQESSIFRKLTVEENLLAILEMRPDYDKKKHKAFAESLMEEFNVSHLRHNLGNNLSGGERRRVEIARALTTEPSFLLLDEPFAGIDPISVNEIQQMIRYLSERGLGILITDHNVRETLTACDRAYIVNDGCIEAEGTPQAILDNQRVREIYLGEHFRI